MATQQKDYTPYLSRRVLRRKPSGIRIIAPKMKIPGMISFAGGYPNIDSFPFESISVNLKNGTSLDFRGPSLQEALEYGPSKGLPSLVNWLKEHQTRVHHPENVPAWDVLVTNGSQDALNIALDTLLNEEDAVLVELPTYSGALAALLPFGCKVVGIETDENGLIPEKLEEVLRTWKYGPKPKALYTIPIGQNPSGSTIPLERKERVYKLACEHDILILEDDPYLYLNFEEPPRSYFSMDTEGRVIRFDSFSKILAGGLRIGWATGPTAILDKMILHMQACAIHPSSVSQTIASRVLENWGVEGFNAHVKGIQEFYRVRRDNFLHYLNKYLQPYAEWSVPKAGMFVWLKLKINPSNIPTLVMEKAPERKVLFVGGDFFMPDEYQGSQYIRASFSTADEKQMDKGLKEFAELLSAESAPHG